MKRCGVAALVAVGAVYGLARRISNEPKDLPGGRYIVSMSYPRIDAKLPLVERRAKTLETEGEFRIGTGVIHRLPFTRTGIVLGSWEGITPGNDPDEKLFAVLEARNLAAKTREISGWGQ